MTHKDLLILLNDLHHLISESILTAARTCEYCLIADQVFDIRSAAGKIWLGMTASGGLTEQAGRRDATAQEGSAGSPSALPTHLTADSPPVTNDKSCESAPSRSVVWRKYMQYINDAEEKESAECECGSEKVGSSQHSTWCKKFRKD